MPCGYKGHTGTAPKILYFTEVYTCLVVLFMVAVLVEFPFIMPSLGLALEKIIHAIDLSPARSMVSSKCEQ